MPVIPAGSTVEGTNYLEFLKLVRAKLPTGKTLSIALPASFWYLKPFPVEKMAATVDYLFYMTYDLHGQWGELYLLERGRMSLMHSLPRLR